MQLNRIENQKERVLTALWMGGEVNVNDLYMCVNEKYLPNLLYRLEKSGLIKRRKAKGLDIKTACLTEDGIDYVYLNYGLHPQDSPSGDLNVKTTGADSINRKQRRARSFMAFSNAGYEITNEVPNITHEVNEPIYIDSYNLKKELKAEVQGARASGVFMTPNELFLVYPENEHFQIQNKYELSFLDRLQRKMELNDARMNTGEIVLSSSNEMLEKLILTTRRREIGGGSYIVKSSDRNKFFVSANHETATQLMLLSHMAERNEVINEKLSDLLGTPVSNLEFKNFKDGYIINLLDLNLGLIKATHELIFKKKKVYVLCMLEQEEMFKELFTKTINREAYIELITIPKEDILSILENGGDE